MKKFYTKATMEVVKMETENHLLEASPEWEGEFGYIAPKISDSSFA